MSKLIISGLLFIGLFSLTFIVAHTQQATYQGSALVGRVTGVNVDQAVPVIKDPVPGPFILEQDLAVSDLRWSRRPNGDVLLSFDVVNYGTKRSEEAVVSVVFPWKKHSEDVLFAVPSLKVFERASYSVVIVSSFLSGEQEFVVLVDPLTNPDVNLENNRASAFVYTTAAFV